MQRCHRFAHLPPLLPGKSLILHHTEAFEVLQLIFARPGAGLEVS